MKVSKVFLLSILSATLAACGSSGGGSSNEAASPTANNSVQTPTATTSNEATTENNLAPSTSNATTTEKVTPAENTTVSTPKPNITGSRYEGYSSTIDWSVNGNNINNLRVWGQNIVLVNPSMVKEGNWLVDASYPTTKTTSRFIGDDLTNARYGVVVNGKETVAFAQGIATPEANIPTSGNAHYEGQYVINAENKSDETDTTKFVSDHGKMLADVNFADKTVVGALETSYTENDQVIKDAIPFSANIRGNSFTQNRAFDDINVSGKFYGENAEEMAGSFVKHNQYSGAFGAKKVETPAK